ncbi:MAG TPA: TadE family protein [Thermoguttaceae bacterium]|nr:TadE family protein [Thermoguttaceae bacterium]
MPRLRFPRFPGRRRKAKSKGAVLVWFAMLLTLMLGMVGLVIDAGMLLSTYRHAQNAADAAAMAAAYDLMFGRPKSEATATAITFVKEHNGLSGAPDPVVNIPPADGPYAGASNYVEVIAGSPMRTFFIHLLPGISRENTVRARAVGGFEMVASGAGVCVLDPNARPGLDVGGGGILNVRGLVIDNSEGGGLDENGDPVDNGNKQVAASVSNNALLRATEIRVVGGVNNPDNFQNYDPGDPTNVLHCNQLPVPDPLLYLPTPTVDNGVDSTFRGAPQASNTNLKLGDQNADAVEPMNYIDTSDPANHVMVLHPGIYQSISVTGGNVRFEPGIYVLRPAANTTNTLKITGGNVEAQGIMFYNTGDNYDPQTGLPDAADYDQPPPAADGANFGAVTINAAMQFAPIDTEQYFYDRDVSAFDGMLFYQRRRNTATADIQGNSEEGDLSGTMYAKWARFKLAGQGTYDAQFFVGSLEVTGLGDVTLSYVGEKKGKAPQVFLVE